MSIKVVNLRNLTLGANEVLVKVDRTTALGNPYVMNRESQRDEVCENYEIQFYKRLKDNDPVLCAELTKIRDILDKGFTVALGCWCYPKRCHAQTIKSYLERWNNKFRVIIAGGREFNNYDMLKNHCDYMLQNKVKQGYDIVIISGKARGADSLGERYARQRGFGIEEYPADWDKYGRRAGYVRNETMAYNANALIAFWDGKSRGTKHMINLAEKHGLIINVKKY